MRLFLLLVVLPTLSLAVDENRAEDYDDSDEEPSLVGIFSGLLETLTETASSKSCPGQCVHTIRAFMCEYVEDEADCPGNLKCCTEHPPRNTTLGPPRPPMRHPGDQGHWNGPPPPNFRPPPHIKYGPPPPGYNRPPQNFGQPPPGYRPPTPPRITEIQDTQVQPEEVETESAEQSTSSLLTSQIPEATTPTPTTASTTTPTPSPVAVTEIAEGPTQPVQNITCPGVCVSARMTSSCEAVYKSLTACKNDLKCCVILDTYTGDRENLFIREDEEEFGTMEDDEEEERFPIPERRPPPMRPESHHPSPSESKPLREPAESNSLPSRNDLPNRDPCPGTCISSFFTFFCDRVLDFECPNEGKCCYNHEPPPQPQERPQRCPRICLPNHMTNACPRALPFICPQGSFCCIGPPVTQAPNYPQQSHDNRPIYHKVHHPPPPPRIRTTTTTTTTTTEVPKELHRPTCPGSCINNLLAFTCFRNAEITDLFTCSKSGTRCCAPKTAIREHLDVINGTEDSSGEFVDGENSNQRLTPQIHPQVPVLQEQVPPPIMPVPPINNHPLRIPPSHQNSELLPPPPPPPAPAMGRIPPTVILPQAKQQNSRSNYVCGLKDRNLNLHPRMKRVVGGADSYPGEWCWQVALINSLNQYLCGAALIGSQWVLTAAHCLTNIVRTGSTIYVRVGDHDLTSKYGSPSAQTLRVATTYIHHNHNSQTLDNDIALLKLQGQVDLREGVCLVCLPARGEGVRSGRRCTVTGYGYMGEAGPIPLRVREATLPIISDYECIRKVNAVTEKTFVLPASSFCAGGEANNDACQGDGGGPLVCQDDGYYELTGLVSWGFGCGREDVPGVYVKVSSFIGWINQIISVNN